MSRPRTSIWYFLVLALLSIAAVVVPIIYNLNQLLTREKIAEAQARWEKNGPASYDLRLVERKDVDEARDVYEVRVRNGTVVELHINDRAEDLVVNSTKQGPALTVPDLFEQMLAHLADEEQGKRRNYATATFDPQLGHPVRYVRRIRGTKERLEWLITVTPVTP